MSQVFDRLNSLEDKLCEVLALSSEFCQELASPPDNVATLDGHMIQFAQFVTVGSSLSTQRRRLIATAQEIRRELKELIEMTPRMVEPRHTRYVELQEAALACENAAR